jgi:hypothetical protein
LSAEELEELKQEIVNEAVAKIAGEVRPFGIISKRTRASAHEH